MSEYTKYYAVKSSSKAVVKERLNNAKILSVVSTDEKKYWISDEYKEVKSNWVTVGAPAISSFKNRNFYYQDRFEELRRLFDDVLFFFEEENASDWILNISHKNEMISIEMYSGKNPKFTSKEKQLIETVFDIKFHEYEHLLVSGEGGEFLNSHGIPYMQICNQDQIGIKEKEGQYSFLDEEITDC